MGHGPFYPQLTHLISGNTAGVTAEVSSGTMVIAGGPNITLSQNGNTISISGGAGAAGNTGYISAGTTHASLGTISISNGGAVGAVQFGIDGQTLTASVSSRHTLSAEGNIIPGGGTSGSWGGQQNVSGEGAVSVAVSQGSIRIRAPAQAISFNLTNLSATSSGDSGGVSLSLSAAAPGGGGGGGVALSAGTQSVSTGTVLFQNSNGISFGMSGSSRITASHNGLTTQLGQNAAASNGTFSFETLMFMNSNNVSFSTATHMFSGTGIAASVAERSNTVGMSNLGNTAGTSGVISGNQLRLHLAGGNGITLSQSINGSSATITVSAGNYLTTAAAWNHSHGNPTLALTNLSGTTASNSAGLTLSLSAAAPGGGGGGGGGTATMWWPYKDAINVTGTQGQATMHIAPVPTPTLAAGGELHIDRLCFPIHHSHGTGNTGTMTMSFWWGAYTKNANTLSLVASTSFSTKTTFSGAANSRSLVGIRLITIPWTTTFQNNGYYVAVISRTTYSGYNCTVRQILVSQLNSYYSGIWGQDTNRSVQWPLGFGRLSVSTLSIPSSVAFSQIDGTHSMAARAPSWFMISGTA